jgi:hypothetical protein
MAITKQYTTLTIPKVVFLRRFIPAIQRFVMNIVMIAVICHGKKMLMAGKLIMHMILLAG